MRKDQPAKKIIYRGPNEYIYQTPPFVGGYLNNKYFLLNYHPETQNDIRAWMAKRLLYTPAPIGKVLVDKLIGEIIKRVGNHEAHAELINNLKNYRTYVETLNRLPKEATQNPQETKYRVSDKDRALAKEREEKTKALKEKREAERQKRKEEKQQKHAEHLRMMQEQQAIKAEKEKMRLFEKRIEYLQKHETNPVAEEKEGYPLFYGSLGGKVYYILLNPEKPAFQFVSTNGAMPISPYELQPILEQIDTHLNEDERFDSALETIGDLYLKFTHNNRIASKNEVANSLYQAAVNTLTRS